MNINHGESWRERATLGMKTAAAVFAILAATAPLSAQDPSADAASGGVNEYYGSFSTEIPITAPEYHNLEPRLKLVYNSGGRDSWLGVGWSLKGFSFIERAAPGGGAPQYGAGDAFFLDGVELIPSTLLGGTHCAKIQNYARIERDTVANKWRVWGTNGNLAVYEPMYATAQGIFRWVLKTVSDPHGNTVTYNYWCDPGNDCYLDNITYNGAMVKFYRELRPDPIYFATGAGMGQTRYRIKTIDVTVGGNRARAYKLEYDASDRTGRSLLERVTQYGDDAFLDGANNPVGLSLPSMVMAYHSPPAGVTSVTWTGSSNWGGSGYTWAADFNGDGYTDLASASGANVYMRLSDGYDFQQETWTVPSQWANESYTFVGDFNGDGMADIATNAGPHINVRLSTGTGFQQQSWPTAALWGGDNYTWTGDFNGDDKTDIASASGGNVYMYISTGNGFVSQTWTTASLWGGHEYTWTGDFNGDGRTDIASASGTNVYMRLSTGIGFTLQTWTAPNQWGSGSYTWIGDYNGDGLSDIASASGTSVFMRLSPGPGSTARPGTRSITGTAPATPGPATSTATGAPTWSSLPAASSASSSQKATASTTRPGRPATNGAAAPIAAPAISTATAAPTSSRPTAPTCTGATASANNPTWSPRSATGSAA